MADDFKRRDLFRVTAGGLLVAGLGHAETPAFFSKDEFAALDELMEAIIPSDSHSPGAKATGCAAYVDRQLAESVDDTQKHRWREGMKLLEEKCRKDFDKSLAEISPDQRHQLLSDISKNEQKPAGPIEEFFNTLKNETAFAYYTSSIGIHKEMQYKGNVYLKEFAGTELP